MAKERSPRQCCSTVEGFFFSFMVAKHPPGYLLSLSFLSSHLQMRWQATPAPTETIKVNNNSMTITSSRCRVLVGQHQNYSMLPLTILPLFGNYFSHTSTYLSAAVVYSPTFHPKFLTSFHIHKNSKTFYVLPFPYSSSVLY